VASVIPPVLFLAFLVAWTWLLNARPGHQMLSPIRFAFSTTAAAGLLLVAGLLGFALDTRARFLTGTRWAGTVIWWEVGAGLMLVPVAAYFWRRAAREVDRRARQTPRF
jgi:membrane protein implicated in regulation of membrane protease activity